MAEALGIERFCCNTSKEVANPFGTLEGVVKSIVPVIGIQLSFPGAPVLSVNDCTVEPGGTV
jgi:hypothetical protein